MDLKQTERIQVMVDPKMLRRIREEAAARGIGMSAFVRWAVLSFLDNASKDEEETE